jgi:hypothetical protein
VNFGMHENLDREEKLAGSSDRAFGFVMAAAFVLLSLAPLWHAPHEPRWWALPIALGFAAIAFGRPAALAPLNRIWQRLGHLLSKIVSPLVLALLFYTTILPIGLLMRGIGRDPLRTRPDRTRDSYWIPRGTPDADAESMKHQF